MSRPRRRNNKRKTTKLRVLYKEDTSEDDGSPKHEQTATPVRARARPRVETPDTAELERKLAERRQKKSQRRRALAAVDEEEDDDAEAIKRYNARVGLGPRKGPQNKKIKLTKRGAREKERAREEEKEVAAAIAAAEQMKERAAEQRRFGGPNGRPMFQAMNNTAAHGAMHATREEIGAQALRLREQAVRLRELQQNARESTPASCLDTPLQTLGM